MDRKQFIELFLKLMEDVLDIHPKVKICEGVWLYVSDDNKVSLPVLTGKEGLSFFLGKIDPRMRSAASKVLDNSLAMIGTMSNFWIDQLGENFQKQVVVSVNRFSIFRKRVRETQKSVDINVTFDAYLEAECVEYICHEFRHLIQLLLLNKEDFFSSFSNLPKFQNEFRIKNKLIKKYRQWTKNQMKGYREHYKGNPHRKRLLKMEKDSMIIGLLAFDCWISQKLSYEDKIKKLKEILFNLKSGE